MELYCLAWLKRLKLNVKSTNNFNYELNKANELISVKIY